MLLSLEWPFMCHNRIPLGCISGVNREESVLWWKKEETLYIVPKYPHFLAIWTKFETFYF